MFKTIRIGNEDYQLRLDIKNLCALEAALKTNPVNVLFRVGNNEIPKLSDLKLMLHYSLQALNHGINMEKTENLFDIYLSENGDIFDLIAVLSEVVKESGVISKKDTETKN